MKDYRSRYGLRVRALALFAIGCMALPVTAAVWALHDEDPNYQTPPFDDTLIGVNNVGRRFFTRSGFNISQTIGGCRAISAALDGSFILVCENVADRMSRLDLSGNAVFTIDRPINAVDVTSAGTIFALEDHSGTIRGQNILRVSPSGEVVQQAPYGGFDLVVDDTHQGIFVVGADIKYLDFNLGLKWTNDPIPWCGVSVDATSDGSAWIAEREHSQVSGSSTG